MSDRSEIQVKQMETFTKTCVEGKFYVARHGIGRDGDDECHYLWPDRQWRTSAFRTPWNHAYYDTREQAEAMLAAALGSNEVYVLSFTEGQHIDRMDYFLGVYATKADADAAKQRHIESGKFIERGPRDGSFYFVETAIGKDWYLGECKR
jgi:hypothetical protein